MIESKDPNLIETTRNFWRIVVIQEVITNNTIVLVDVLLCFMKIFLVCLLCCCVSGIFIDPNTFRIKPKGCSRPPPDGKIPSKIQSLQPWKYVKSEDLPNSFDWRWKDSRVMVTPIQNQFMPKFCGSLDCAMQI